MPPPAAPRLAELWPTAGARSALVVGAGATAATSLVALARSGIRSCQVVARSPGRAQTLLDRLREARLLSKMEVAIVEPGAGVKPAEVVVNATPLGRTGHRLPIGRRSLRTTTVVVDWVYRPGGTALTTLARERRIATVDGARLLLEQGQRALVLFLGRAISDKVQRAMRRALARKLNAGAART